MLGAAMDPVPASSQGPQGELHFKAVCAASSCAGGIWLEESHTCSGVPWNLSPFFIKYHWRQRESVLICPPNPQDSVYFGALNL